MHSHAGIVQRLPFHSPASAPLWRCAYTVCKLTPVAQETSFAVNQAPPPSVIIQNDAARDPLLQGGSVHALPQRLGGGDGFKFVAIPKTSTVFQYENSHR